MSPLAFGDGGDCDVFGIGSVVSRRPSPDQTRNYDQKYDAGHIGVNPNKQRPGDESNEMKGSHVSS